MTPHYLARAYVAALGTAGEAAAREALLAVIQTGLNLPEPEFFTPGRVAVLAPEALTAWRRAVRRSTGGPAGAPVKPRVWVSVLVTEATAERLRKRGEGTVTVYGVRDDGGEVCDG